MIRIVSLLSLLLLLFVLFFCVLLTGTTKNVDARISVGNHNAANEASTPAVGSNDGDGNGNGNDEAHGELLRRLSLLAENDEVRVIVGYKNNNGKASLEANLSQIRTNFRSIRAEAGTLHLRRVRELLADPNIDYVEPDDEVRGTAAEAVPYGIIVTENGPNSLQARSATSARSSSLSTGACSRSSSLKVAVLDSGVDSSHPDLPCSKYNCIGRDFTNGRGGGWNNPESSHGTHVFGIIAALGRNNQYVYCWLWVWGCMICWTFCALYRFLFSCPPVLPSKRINGHVSPYRCLLFGCKGT